MKKHCQPQPQLVTPLTDVQCYGCGWKGILAEAKQSVYLDIREENFIPAAYGGNGKNWRCPICNELIFMTRRYKNDPLRKDHAPHGHQYREAV